MVGLKWLTKEPEQSSKQGDKTVNQEPCTKVVMQDQQSNPDSTNVKHNTFYKVNFPTQRIRVQCTAQPTWSYSIQQMQQTQNQKVSKPVRLPKETYNKILNYCK